MSKIHEKVKDLVELRPYSSVDDFLRDPAVTLANYHFTDITTELIVKWLDSISTSAWSGSCRALAGFRGVGKSHFLAMVSALAALPELRSRLDESHASSAAQRLPRRHYPVVNVRRGRRASLAEEFIEAVGVVADIAPGSAGTSIRDVLRTARTFAGELPLVILIDTDTARPARVERNDGETLAEIAAAAKETGCFVGVALDDDIAGADGANAAISGNYTIDFLDPEHLYKVVNGRIFPKNPSKQGTLTRVYESIRQILPDFRWSQQRFASVYPLHPAALEIAPFVRLYVPNFAILGFASAAGEKALERPAGSLIGMEEVFDAVEADLRKLDDLKSAFTTFDDVVGNVIGKMPEQSQPRAKVILKAVFLHSLEGRGSSKADIAYSSLRNGGADDQLLDEVDKLLASFAQGSPEGLVLKSSDGSPTLYSIRLGSDEFSALLESGIATLPADLAETIFRRAVSSRFPEFDLDASSDIGTQPIQLNVEWRGGLRPGQIFWGHEPKRPATLERHADWEMVVNFGSGMELKDASMLEWRPGQLRDDERKTLLSHHLLLNDPQIRSKYGERLSTAVQTHAHAVAGIVERIMLADAVIVIDGFDFNFSEQARGEGELPRILSVMLGPLFETRFPDHPYFSRTLTPSTVEKFVSAVFGRSHEFSPESAELAQTFGVPLSIAREGPSGVSAVTKNDLKQIDPVNRLLKLFPERSTQTVSKASAAAVLGEPPVGLVTEAQHLILGAMVANGLVEFVTTRDDRINGRSLDLKINWSEVKGIALPRSAAYSQEKLVRWGRLISANDAITNLENAEERSAVLSAMVDISADWTKQNPLCLIENVPDNALSTAIWRSLEKTTESYSVMMQSIEEVLFGTIDLEECLYRVGTLFGDNSEEFDAAQNAAGRVENFSHGHHERDRIRTYLALSDITDDAGIEQARKNVTGAVELSEKEPSEKTNREMGYEWEKFKRAYADFYIGLHSKVMGINGQKLHLDQIFKSDQWRVFQCIADVPHIRSKYFHSVRDIQRDIDAGKCFLDPSPFLERAPFCECGFRIPAAGTREKLFQQLSNLVESAIHEFELIVSNNTAEITDELGSPAIPTEHLTKLTVNGLSNEQMAALVRALSMLDEQNRLGSPASHRPGLPFVKKSETNEVHGSV